MSINVNEIFKVMETIGVKQVIFQGPPGTSKTHGAKELIKSVMSENTTDEELKECKLTLQQYESKRLPDGKRVFWDMVQFHPSYSYEDFVRGITVETEDSKKTVTYRTINKIFGSICELAAENDNNGNDKIFFLIIDEINRADVATVFGELIYALEYRNHDIATPYKVEKTNERNIKVPDNLYIIGTMNTADKSVGTIDMAIRRRFLFVDLLPEEKIIIKHFEEKNGDESWESLRDGTIKCFEALKEIVSSSIKGTYKAKDFQIGHTYFLPDFSKVKSAEDAKQVIQYKLMYQVLPMLREYTEDRILDSKNIAIEKTIGDVVSLIADLKEYLEGSDKKVNEIAEKLINLG